MIQGAWNSRAKYEQLTRGLLTIYNPKSAEIVDQETKGNYLPTPKMFDPLLSW